MQSHKDTALSEMSLIELVHVSTLQLLCTCHVHVQVKQWNKVELSALDVAMKRSRGNQALGIESKNNVSGWVLGAVIVIDVRMSGLIEQNLSSLSSPSCLPTEHRHSHTHSFTP